MNDKQLLKEHWNIYVIAEIFVEMYPEDVFPIKPFPIVNIREGFKEILDIRDNNRKGVIKE